MAYTEVPASSSGGSSVAATYPQALWAFARAAYPTLGDYDFIPLNRGATGDYDSFVTGSGANTSVISAGRGGVIEMNTSAVNGSTCMITPKAGGIMTEITLSKTGGAWFEATRLKYNSVIDSKTYAITGLINAIRSANVAIFGIIGTTSIVNLTYGVSAAAVVQTATPVPALGTYFTLAVGFDGTTMKGWVGDPQGTMTLVFTETSIAALIDSSAMPFMQAVCNGAGAIGTVIDCDSMFAAWALTA